MKKTVRVLFSLILLLNIVKINSSSKIITNKKQVSIQNTAKVTDRELAMLASLVYEDVPNDNNYSNSYLKKGCTIENGEIKKSCYFDVDETHYATRDGYKILEYVEGMSDRKRNLFTTATTARIEDGEKYYFYTFASTKEEAKNWEIVNYKKVSSKNKKNSVSWSGEFSAITFKKGNNYVIAFRGTDYPDVLEWLQDVAYALEGEHKQAKYARDYAISEYNDIVNSDSVANIYITGHSLGAYLAQIGGAAIVDAGKTDAGFDTSKSSHLKKVVYFNGMGVSGIGLKTQDTKKYRDALEFLGKTSTEGVSSPNTLSYSDEKSSGRLILYSMDGDPVSGIGIHYGEIRKLQPAADAISNHKGNHIIGSTGRTEKASKTVAKIANLIKKAKGSEINDTNIAISGKEAEQKIKAILETALRFTELKKKFNDRFDNLRDKYNIALPELGNNYDSGMYGVFDIKNFFSNFSSMADKYGLGDITEVANISHETDSFLCLIDDDFGIPSITGAAVNAKYSTSKNAIAIKANGKDNLLLTAKAKDGCIRSYEWYKTDASGNVISKLKTDRNSINNYVNIAADDNIKNGDVIYYKLVAKYGNTYKTQKLQPSSSGKYDYVLENQEKTFADEEAKTQGKTKVLTQMYEIKYDTELPKCSFSTNSIKLGKGKTTQVKFTCTDNSGIVALDKNGFKLTGKDYYIKHSATCKKNTCTITIKAKALRLLRVNTELTYNTEVYDNSGNHTQISNRLKISTKK